MDKGVVDWLTTMAIAAVAIGLTQLTHEGTHALSCVAVGADLQEFSALHVSCDSDTAWQSKIVSGSASLINIMIGFLLLRVLLHARQQTPARHFFLWLLMLMNWLVGSGYLMFSGIANVGDLANVIAGLEPLWLWRLLMTVVGAGLYLFLVWLALKALGTFIGGNNADEQISRAAKLGAFSYLAVFLVILVAGLFNAYGITGLPAVAALMLALGGMFPLLWMMQWFRAKQFIKQPQAPLSIHRSWSWILGGALMLIVYSVILGRTLYF